MMCLSIVGKRSDSRHRNSVSSLINLIELLLKAFDDNPRLSVILVSRLLLNLRQVSHTSGENFNDGSGVGSAISSVRFVSRVIGTMGGSLGPDEGDEDDSGEGEYLDSDIRISVDGGTTPPDSEMDSPVSDVDGKSEVCV